MVRFDFRWSLKKGLFLFCFLLDSIVNLHVLYIHYTVYTQLYLSPTGAIRQPCLLLTFESGVCLSESRVLSLTEDQTGASWQLRKRGALFIAIEQQEGEKEANSSWQDM